MVETPLEGWQALHHACCHVISQRDEEPNLKTKHFYHTIYQMQIHKYPKMILKAKNKKKVLKTIKVHNLDLGGLPLTSALFKVWARHHGGSKAR